MADVASKVDKEKIKELVSTEIDLEKQLENVQRQLLSLKQLPSEIESHLRIVSEQLQMIMQLSGVQNGATANNEQPSSRDEHDETEEQDETDFTEDFSYTAYYDEQQHQRIVEQTVEEEEETETQELEGTLSVKSEEGSRVKKFVVSYETKVIKSPSPAPSHGSFEPDPKLSPKDQVIQELQTNLPNYDHLMNSSVYKMIHKMDREPKKGIPARPAKVNAAEDIIERVKSPALSVADDRSTRSVSH
ncbi:hypothetical protein WN55_07482 [Dufourea novaeangliae]|uniref:Uncharacterized protein n=1 Tax=Dufourea novaeangliae TaxID=178035 RepID=A0A154PS87_DUFNO|nr:hypothetical protein WN55_07482 [Dufourea novaeangliae]